MQVPANVGKYELLEFLGGGMSHVYRARDTVIDRPVVVKLLTDDACKDAGAKARFLQEARLGGNIQHEHIVSVFDFGEHEGRPFIVMEYLKGEDLRDAIRGGRTGSLVERMEIALEVAEALEYVNARGIVHRDIKPENIHLDLNRRVKLMDFGIAKTADLSLTKTGMTMGTPYYMAPEQISGKPVMAQVDIYAFGLVFYELLTGARGVNGDAIEAVMYQILNLPLDPAPMVNAGIPPQVRALVLHCVEKKPENRPQSFREVVEELSGLISGLAIGKTQPVVMKTVPLPVSTVPLPVPAPLTSAPELPISLPPQAQPPEPPRPRPAIALWSVLATLAVGIAAGAGWWVTRGRTPVEPSPKKETVIPVPQIPGMIYIPAGSFLSGKQNTPVSLPAFYIDETEVSNAEFADYCKVQGCAPPKAASGLPVVNVTVAQARDYAAWAGKRLPSALEWERAARGTQGGRFPWGDQEDASLANVAGKALQPVKSYAAYHDVYQMAGNAWEMVDGEVTPSSEAVATFSSLKPPATAEEKWITMRGGSFKTPLAFAVASEFVAIPERLSSSEIGFRCAKSAHE
ncbi:MAG: bifunctional serine/threonine-protein kinase/formylglycine-generating enzyme family protein [Bryobacteraceae bacterium]